MHCSRKTRTPPVSLSTAFNTRAYGACAGCAWVSPFRLDFGMEFSPLRARLLVGTAVWRHKVDAFLYYGVTGVRGAHAHTDAASSLSLSLTAGSAMACFITQWARYGSLDSWGLPWNPAARSGWPTYTENLRTVGFRMFPEVEDGEGQLAVPGPTTSRWGGVLATPQLMGVRDGIGNRKVVR
eukprot:SAG11_NODE_478_length_9117_cov_6.916168_2_plen_182_part_00